MSLYNSDLSSNLYDHIQTINRPAINRTGSALAKGAICALDLTGAGATETQTYATWIAQTAGQYKDTQHPLSALIVPATAHLTGWLFAVAIEAIADDAVGMCCFQGFCQILGVGGSDFANGDLVTIADGVHTATKLGANEVPVAMALEADGATSALKWCILNGAAFCNAGVGT